MYIRNVNHNALTPSSNDAPANAATTRATNERIRTLSSHRIPKTPVCRPSTGSSLITVIAVTGLSAIETNTSLANNPYHKIFQKK
jgi:hypothetical protein